MKTFVLLFFILLTAASGDSFAAVTYINDDTENVKGLPIPISKHPPQYHRVIYSVPVTLKAGDIVLVNGQTEVTNDVVKLAMFCTYLILSDSETGVTQDWTDVFTKPLGTNLDTHYIHHHSEKISASVKMDHDFTGYLNFVGYARTAPQMLIKNRPRILTVNQGYGNMAVTILSE
jgi:hypothetical protein